MKKYNAKDVLVALSPVCKISYDHRVISPKDGVDLGIKRLGKIDYLVNYCDWRYDAKGAFFN